MTTRIMPRKPPSDGWALSLVWLAAAARLLPHFSNFTPVGAAGLFSGARLRGWRACVVPLAAMLLSDVALSLRYGWPVLGWMRLVVYLSLLAYVALGRALRDDHQRGWRLPAAAIAGGLQFFVV